MPEMLPMSSSSSWEEPTTTVIAILVRHVTTVSPQHLEAVCQWKVFMNSLEDAPSKLQPLEGLQLPKQFTVHIEGYPYVLDCTILTTAGYDTKGRPQCPLVRSFFSNRPTVFAARGEDPSFFTISRPKSSNSLWCSGFSSPNAHAKNNAQNASGSSLSRLMGNSVPDLTIFAILSNRVVTMTVLPFTIVFLNGAKNLSHLYSLSHDHISSRTSKNLLDCSICSSCIWSCSRLCGSSILLIRPCLPLNSPAIRLLKISLVRRSTSKLRDTCTQILTWKCFLTLTAWCWVKVVLPLPPGPSTGRTVRPSRPLIISLAAAYNSKSLPWSLASRLVEVVVVTRSLKAAAVLSAVVLCFGSMTSNLRKSEILAHRGCICAISDFILSDSMDLLKNSASTGRGPALRVEELSLDGVRVGAQVVAVVQRLQQLGGQQVHQLADQPSRRSQRHLHRRRFAGTGHSGTHLVDLKKPAFARALKPSCRNPWLTVAAKTMMSSGLIFTAVRIHCYGILDTARIQEMNPGKEVTTTIVEIGI
uniref:Uncharacterized protein n=2 Tax=Oryza barthii TaxID=65489 RepID=A0A0D3HAS5_9ORYZ